MAESMNRTVEYACKGTSFLGLQNYGKIMVGDKSFEFYDDRNVENYIQIPWEELDSLSARENAVTGGRTDYKELDRENVIAVRDILTALRDGREG